MPVTDPIADMLTRIRNAQRMGHDALTLPASNLKRQVAEVLRDEGYIEGVDVKADGPKTELTLTLKYGPGKSPTISEIRRVSRPGRRVYVTVRDLPRVKNGLGIAVVSTSRGVMVDRTAREQRLGGELLCTVW